MDDYHNVINLNEPQNDITTDLSETAKMYDALEERLKAMETSNKPGFKCCCDVSDSYGCYSSEVQGSRF